ncbi:Signal-peptide peptidase, presenilin aspartyl protease [uncultured archaeon]|nr:Signal-peptide peptidase, presenilin aspartyl protease [uncultured archaeon]
MKHTWIITGFLVLMFFAAQVIGLLITRSYVDVSASAEKGELVWKDLSVAGVPINTPDVEPVISTGYIIGAVLLGTLLILLIIRLNTVWLWKLWFYFAVVMCLSLAFGAFIPALYAFIIALVFGFFKVFRPNIYLHNLTELFVYGGLAVIFVRMLDVKYSFILLILLSLYDMYAVWKSKHMVKMAKFQTKSGIFAGLLVPYAAPRLKGVKRKVRTAVLGGGDIGFPLIFAGTVLIASNLASALIVSVCATIALSILLLLSQKDRFYPAIPFLTAGCAVGYLITLLL